MIGSKGELKRAVGQVAAEGGGMIVFDAVRVRDVPLLFAEALGGNQEARMILQAVEHALVKIKEAPQRRPMLCASCPRPVRNGDKFAVAVLRGATEQPSQAITLAVCLRCGPTPGAIKAAATVGVRRFFPDARPRRDDAPARRSGMTGNRQNSRPPMVLTRLWAKTSGKGNRYLTGRLGAVKILIMENRDRQGDDDATHIMMLAEPGEKPGSGGQP